MGLGFVPSIGVIGPNNFTQFLEEINFQVRNHILRRKKNKELSPFLFLKVAQLILLNTRLQTLLTK
jgi:hypothetical protein